MQHTHSLTKKIQDFFYLGLIFPKTFGCVFRQCTHACTMARLLQTSFFANARQLELQLGGEGVNASRDKHSNHIQSCQPYWRFPSEGNGTGWKLLKHWLVHGSYEYIKRVSFVQFSHFGEASLTRRNPSSRVRDHRLHCSTPKMPYNF